MSPGLRRLLGPGLMTLVMIVVLAGLGTWQVERLAWKNRILAEIARAEAAPPVPLATDPPPFAKVAVTGRLRHDRTALYGAEVRPVLAGNEMGGRLIVAMERDGAPPVLIDRGWVPEKRDHATTQPAGDVTVTGYVHPAEHAGWFSAADDPVARRFFTLDPKAIGDALDEPGAEPFVVVALGPIVRGEWPEPAQHLPRPPNNHLAYAVTWYGLAVALVVIFITWAAKGSRT